LKAKGKNKEIAACAYSEGKDNQQLGS